VRSDPSPPRDHENKTTGQPPEHNTGRSLGAEAGRRKIANTTIAGWTKGSVTTSCFCPSCPCSCPCSCRRWWCLRLRSHWHPRPRPPPPRHGCLLRHHRCPPRSSSAESRRRGSCARTLRPAPEGFPQTGHCQAHRRRHPLLKGLQGVEGSTRAGEGEECGCSGPNPAPTRRTCIPTLPSFPLPSLL
jgi:hypothetical protein